MMFKTTEVSAESARDTTTLAYDEETKDVTDISVRPTCAAPSMST